jgi:hypothetical protein
VVLVCPGNCPAIYPEICHVGNNIKKITVLRNLRHAHLLEVGMMKILGDHKTLSILRHVGFHVDFSSMKSSLGL